MLFITPNSLFSKNWNSVKIKSKLFVPKVIRFINKYLYKIGLIGAIMNRYDNSVTFYSASKDKKLYKDYSKKSKFINFGSGGFSHPLWINYDFPGQSDYYKMLQGKKEIDFHPINLCIDDLKIHYEDNSCDLIYCSHTLEHLEEEKALNFLKECQRILKPNSIMRVALPNTENNFYYAKIIYDQEKIPRKVKDEVILDCAKKLLSETENLPNDEVIKKVIEANFSIQNFIEILRKENNLPFKFIEENPERHITYYSHEKLIDISKKLNFKFYTPLYKGSSLADPFKNLEVFDTTEPQWSIYGEFIK